MPPLAMLVSLGIEIQLARMVTMFTLPTVSSFGKLTLVAWTVLNPNSFSYVKMSSWMRIQSDFEN